MSVTLQLKPEIEEGVRARAREHGVSLNGYVIELREMGARATSHDPGRGEEKDEAFLKVIRPDSVEVFREWRRIVVRPAMLGVKVHDARLAALMKVHGIQRIVTFHRSDFYDLVEIGRWSREGCWGVRF